MGDYHDNPNFLFIEGVFLKDIIKKRVRRSGYKTKNTINKLAQKLIVIKPKCDHCQKKNRNEKFSIIYGINTCKDTNNNLLSKSTEKFCSNSCVKKYIKSKYDYSKSFNLLQLLDYQRKSIDI
jgi:hypothetical protein